MEEIRANYLRIAEKIEAVASRTTLSSKVSLCAVSKRQPIERVQAFCEIFHELQGEPALLGENYVQEYADKKDALPAHRAHLIGPLQRNKAKDAIKLFECIQSAHSEKLLKELEKRAGNEDKTIPLMLQINISDDDAKSGFQESELAPLLANWGESYPHLQLIGGMTITALYDDPEEARPDFARLYRLVSESQEQFSDAFTGDNLEVSMGMSGDFEVAIEEGATLVRVGSALFGPRPPLKP